MEIFPQGNMPFQTLKTAYHVDVQLMMVVAASETFRELLSQFEDYRKFLYSRPSREEAYKNIEELSSGTRVVDINMDNAAVRDAIFTSHMAACCVLFKGSNFFIDQIQSRNEFLQMLEQKLARFEFAEPKARRDLSVRFHTMDAVRTMEILRYFGLVSSDTAGIEQLGLGAGTGYKDIWHLHLLPSITSQIPPNPPPERHGDPVLVFDSIVGLIKDIVVIDGDPQHKETYERLSAQERPHIVALNEDMDAVLDSLPALLTEKSMNPRNMVTAIRFDHRMFPDVDHFLKQLKNIISDEADLILSIGAGHVLEDFEGRVNTMNSFFEKLHGLGMKPVLFKLHGQGNLEQQRQNPRFGTSGITTYQILYCRLQKTALA